MGLFGSLTVAFVPLLLMLFSSGVVVVEACDCFPGLTLCDHFWSADVVLRAEAVGRYYYGFPHRLLRFNSHSTPFLTTPLYMHPSIY